MGLFWIKALELRAGHANVIGHLDSVLALMSAGMLDPSVLVTHHMSLEEAPAAYELYDRREALKIILEALTAAVDSARGWCPRRPGGNARTTLCAVAGCRGTLRP